MLGGYAGLPSGDKESRLIMNVPQEVKDTQDVWRRADMILVPGAFPSTSLLLGAAG
jgi:hypothetical protein